MTDLVAAVAPACSITDDSAGCYTASWYLIWDQVRYWLLIQVPVVALSIVYEWLELASHRYVERLRKLCDSPLTNIVNYLVQLVTSFYVCVNWIVRGGSLAVSFSSWSVESLFLIATGVGYGVRWLAAKNKVTFVLQLHNLFDLLSVVAHFAISIQTIVVGTKRLRSWLDFGFIRSYVGYVVVDHLFTRYPNKTFFSQVLLVVFKALCLVFFFAAVLFSLEQLGELPHTNSFLLHVYQCSNENGTETILRATNEGTDAYPNCDETWSFFSSIYFMFVTVSTVGYGDFSPHTVLGQLTVCVIIVFGIYTFANESAAFMTLYGDQRGTLVNDVPLQNHARYGSIHEAYSAMEEGGVNEKKRNVKPLVSKWMHRGGSLIRETHIVVLMQFDKAGENASYQREVMDFVEQNPRYHKRVFLVYGSPLRDTDLRNAQLDRAMAVFFLPDKYSDDGNKEDAATVLRVLSVSQQKNEHTQLFAMLANSDNRTLLEATGLNKDNLVCADEIRLGLMGLSCRCPGLSTVVSNLITSRSGELPNVPPEQAHLVKPWVSEYISGAANEIYSCCLTKHFHGMNFIQATMHIHRQSNGLVLLIAVESDGEIAFNPGNEAGYDDSKAIFNAILVNSALQRSKIFTIIELRDVNNNRFLDPVPSFGSTRKIQGGDFIGADNEYDVKSRLSSHRGPLSSGGRDSAQYSRASTVTKKRNWVQRKSTMFMRALSSVNTFFLGSLRTAAQQVSTYGAESDDVNGMTIESLYNGDDGDTFFQERFMNGALFPSYVADDLLIQSFFNPSLNMFIRKILDGKSCFVLYDVPRELRGRQLLYGELFEYMTSGVAHTLPIGLLRAKGGPGGAPYPYVYTCPSSDTIVYAADKIFVLINVMAINRLANKLQRRFRGRTKSSMTLADLVENLSRPSQL
ncbi:Voltage-gated Ion Channel (VIC) Superfamily [Phytophthora cinnamomi]|uniref:Voltage-gated Ion Channel (VIC) Superfamily n=1 Tax=Phytophthora cinnamomi TaxID=4785 RepID=UPI00355A2B53|nr:Voltage-gated Ion Channel (VIC) Superfamily [Phytophthora cinnamomi]